MTLSIPQMILIGLNLFAACVNIYKDGQPRTAKKNFYLHGIAWLFEVYVLSTTSFFDNFGFVQGIWGLISAIGLISTASLHGEVPKNSSYQGTMSVLAFGIVMTIYYFGGFFN
jgi:hypothetical protein